MQKDSEMVTTTRGDTANPVGKAAAPAMIPVSGSKKPRKGTVNQRRITYVAVVVFLLGAWEVASLFESPLFLPGPGRVARTGWHLLMNGQLTADMGISAYRIIVGWLVGTAIALPAGLVAGRITLVRTAFEPLINFFRFIPSLAFITLAIVWFGLGETATISLIVYTAAFFVFINVSAGAQRIDTEKIRAALSLGATRTQLIRTVIIPASIPDIMTGVRLAMGVSFMTVIAAELVDASSGVGFMIYNSRIYGESDIAFVGIFALGFMGLVADGMLRLLFHRWSYRYNIKY